MNCFGALPESNLLTCGRRQGRIGEVRKTITRKNMKSKHFFIAAAFLSFLLSVGIWFLSGNESQAIFVGIWVPSILSLGKYFGE